MMSKNIIGKKKGEQDTADSHNEKPRKRKSFHVAQNAYGGAKDSERGPQRKFPKGGKAGCKTCGKMGHTTRECRHTVCRRCGKKGHIELDCRGPPKDGKSKDLQCYNCGGFGHVQRQCKKPKQSFIHRLAVLEKVLVPPSGGDDQSGDRSDPSGKGDEDRP
jgi:hypothetical protein